MEEQTQTKREWKPGTGGLYKNSYKPEGDHKQPAMRGTICLPDGKLYRIAAWTRFNSQKTPTFSCPERTSCLTESLSQFR